MGLQIYGNIDAGSLATGKVQNINDLSTSGIRDLVAGDSQDIELFLTSQTGLVNIQDYSVRLAIGSLNAKPTGGTWTLGSSSAIDHDVSATGLQTVIASEVASNTTTELAPFTFKTVFSSNGSQTIPAIDATGLTPSSSVSITKLVTGDASTKEQWLTRLFANPLTLQDTWTNFTKTGVGEGISGSLSIGTPEIYNEFTSTITSFSSTLELEITDTAGNVNTIFQIPVTIGGEVIGAGISVSSLSPSNFQTASDVNTTIDSATSQASSLYVSADRGNDATGTRNSTTKPYATLAGAYADSQSSDTIFIQDGDFSSASTLTITKTLTIVLNGVRNLTKIGDLSTNSTLTLIGTGVKNEVGNVTSSGSFQAQNLSMESLTFTGTTASRVDNCSLVGGSNPSLTISSTGFHERYFKDSIISSSGDNSVFLNETQASILFDNCQIGNFSASGHNVFEIANTTTVPDILALKDCVISVADSSDNPFNKSSSATTVTVDFVGGATELSYFTNQSDFGIDGNYVINSRSQRLPYINPF